MFQTVLQLMIRKKNRIKRTYKTFACWYFVNYSFKFQPHGSNRCHDLLLMSVNFSDISILNIKSSNYRCIISLISKKDAINLLQNADLTEKSKT